MMEIREMKDAQGKKVPGWALWIGGKIALIFPTEKAAVAAKEFLLEQQNAEFLKMMEQGLIKAWDMMEFCQKLQLKLAPPPWHSKLKAPRG